MAKKESAKNAQSKSKKPVRVKKAHTERKPTRKKQIADGWTDEEIKACKLSIADDEEDWMQCPTCHKLLRESYLHTCTPILEEVEAPEIELLELSDESIEAIAEIMTQNILNELTILRFENEELKLDRNMNIVKGIFIGLIIGIVISIYSIYYPH